LGASKVPDEYDFTSDASRHKEHANNGQPVDPHRRSKMRPPSDARNWKNTISDCDASKAYQDYAPADWKNIGAMKLDNRRLSRIQDVPVKCEKREKKWKDGEQVISLHAPQDMQRQ
jgi:hypothetical protein